MVNKEGDSWGVSIIILCNDPLPFSGHRPLVRWWAHRQSLAACCRILSLPLVRKWTCWWLLALWQSRSGYPESCFSQVRICWQLILPGTSQPYSLPDALWRWELQDEHSSRSFYLFSPGCLPRMSRRVTKVVSHTSQPAGCFTDPHSGVPWL